MKRDVKEYLMGMSDILRNKRSNSKRTKVERVYSVTKKNIQSRKSSCHYC